MDDGKGRGRAAQAARLLHERRLRAPRPGSLVWREKGRMRKRIGLHGIGLHACVAVSRSVGRRRWYAPFSFWKRRGSRPLMYWPSGSARRLCVASAGLPDAAAAQALHMTSVRNATLWLVLTRIAILVWRARPAELLAAVVRTPRSLDEYGANVHAVWCPDASVIVVQVRTECTLTGRRHNIPSSFTMSYSRPRRPMYMPWYIRASRTWRRPCRLS